MSTALEDIGQDTVTVGLAADAGSAQLETMREIFAVAANRRLWKDLTVQLNFKNDHKDGTRQFARGTSNAMEFLAEPIDHNMQQLEAAVAYAGSKLQLTGGYYATQFDNEHTALNIVGGAPELSGGTFPFTPIALPPDNQSHQLYLSGGYSFSPTTRATFKAAYARLEQDDDFILASSTGRTNLGGRVDVTTLYAGLTMRPMPKLSLLGQLRYEDRDDQTPIARYFTGASPTSTSNGDNEPRSIRTTFGKVDATYELPLDLRLTGGVSYEEKTRSVSPVRVVSARDETRELTYRAELRRSLSESLTGALMLAHADRDGSPYLTTTLNNGTPGSNLVAPIFLADRDRDKVRLTLDWVPTEPLSVQLYADYCDDSYSGRTFGPKTGRAEMYSLDVGYTFSENLQATLWGSTSITRLEQETQVSAPSGQLWSADVRNHDDSYGLELRATVSEQWQVGADFLYADYRDEYRQQAITGTPISSLPDINNRQTRLGAFVTYALSLNSGVRLDVSHEQWHTDDWTWATWTYTDGTRVLEDPDQRVTFVSLSAYLKTW
jgi:MtrB/PioB family decaheme-associated outer membrane protein